jgi:HK97 family phage major capsid protein
MKESSVVLSAGATTLQMTTKTHQLPTLANDFTVSWIAEEGTITDAAPGTPFGQGTLTAKKLAALVTVSIELVQDNVINLMDFVLRHLLQQAGRAVDLQALEGDGTTFSGLFSVAGVNSVAGGSNALSEDELRKLIYGGEHATTLENGVIFAHPWIMRDAIGLAISSGTPWFATVFGQDQQGNARPRNIWGVPAMLTSIIAKNRGGGTNETTAYHGDPSYIVIGQRMGTTFEVDPYGKFDTAQLRLRLLQRTGVLIWVPAYFTKLTAVTVS